jgi:hypothetical protein
MTAIQAEYMTAEYRLASKSSQVQKEATSQFEVHTTRVIKLMHLGLIEVHVSQLVYQQRSGVNMFRLAGRPDTGSFYHRQEDSPQKSHQKWLTHATILGQAETAALPLFSPHQPIKR